MMDIIQQSKVSRIVESDSDRKKSEENAQKFSKMLNFYLSREFDEKKRLTESVTGHTVNAYGDEYELYLRVTPPKGGIWNSDTMVIARIGFKEHRRGHGRKFMAFLVECAESIGYSKIGLECTNDKSDAFGKRFGLQKHGVYNHLLGTVDTVTNNLK